MGVDKSYSMEKEKVYPTGSVFEYSVDSGKKDKLEMYFKALFHMSEAVRTTLDCRIIL